MSNPKPHNNAKKHHFAIMDQRCRAVGLTLNDYKRNPALLYSKEKEFAGYIRSHFNYHDKVKWFNREIFWEDEFKKLDKIDDDDHLKWIANKDITTEGNIMQKNVLLIISFISDYEHNARDPIPIASTSNSNKRPADTELERDNAKQPHKSGEKRPSSNLDVQEQTPKKLPKASTAVKDITKAPTTSTTNGNTVPMQIDTPAGNSANTKGSVSGESGSRKQQKLSYFWGDIQVPTMTSYTFIHLFETKEAAKNMYEFVETVYDSADLRSFTSKGMSIRNGDGDGWCQFDANKECYVVCVTLPFNIGLTTYYDKFSKGCKMSQTYHIRIMQLLDDPDNDEEFEKTVKAKIRIYLNMDDFGVNWKKEFERMKERKSFTSQKSVAKKRKCNFD